MVQNNNGAGMPFSGKCISILGDSISTFAGYIPDGNRPRYPDSENPRCDVRDVHLTWWMRLIDRLDAYLGINESWAGSCVGNCESYDHDDVGPGAAMASVRRIRNLGANGIPDVILFFGGTNDKLLPYPVGAFDPLNAPDGAEFDAVCWDTFADAYTAAVLRIRAMYPQACLLCILPSDYGRQLDASYNVQMRAVCKHYGIPHVILSCLTTDMLYDGYHPVADAMALMADMIRQQLMMLVSK